MMEVRKVFSFCFPYTLFSKKQTVKTLNKKFGISKDTSARCACKPGDLKSSIQGKQELTSSSYSVTICKVTEILLRIKVM